MKKLLNFVALLMVLVVVTACGDNNAYTEVKGDPLKARIYTLDNGLKVYMNVNRETPRIQTFVAVRVGGKNDPAETTGLAHYFEHLMFKGSHKFGTSNYEAEKPMLDKIEELFEVYRVTTDEAERKALYKLIDSVSYEASKLSIPNEYDKLMSLIGSQGTNAFTSFDVTAYIEDIPSNQIENWAMIQADRFKNSVIRGFHTELETVYEEKNMSLTNDNRKLREAVLKCLYPNHPYGQQTVLGTQEHLKNPSIINIKNYYKQYYVPNNMAICLSGDFDPSQMLSIIKKYFGDMEPNPNLPKLQYAEEKPITEPISYEVMGREAESLNLAWRIGGAASAEAEIAELAGMILYNGMAGLVDLNLNQQQKVLSAYGYASSMADYGMVLMAGRPKQGQSLDDVKELLLSEVAKLRAGEFDEALLQATINNLKVQRMNYLDTNSGRARAFLNCFINGTEWADEVSYLDRLSKLTKDDVVRFANEKLGANAYVAVYKRQGVDPNEMKMSKPEITPIVTNRDMQSEFVKQVAETDVRPIEPQFVNFAKDMTKLTADNGIEVLYKRNETNGIGKLTYLFETGTNSDPALSIMSQYIDYLGTSTKTAEQISAEFYDLACEFSVSTQMSRTYVTISGLDKNLPRAMALFAELVADAQPNDAILENLKGDVVKSRADAKHNQAQNFAALRRYLYYGGDAVKSMTFGNSQLKNLTSTELLSKLKELFNSQHTILYYGPQSNNELLATIDNSHKPEGELKGLKAVRPKSIETIDSKVFLAEYDSPQIYYLQYSNRGEKFDVANYAPLGIYNEYFGGSMSSIVFQEMREARGLAYSARASLATPGYADEPYTFTAFIATQNDKMTQAIDAFDEIINDMPESEAAFEVAKKALVDQLRTMRTVKDRVLWSYVDMRDMGLEQSYYAQMYDEVQKMTLADVKAVQQKWVKDRPYYYAILGKSKELDTKKLNSLGKVQKVTQEEIFGY